VKRADLEDDDDSPRQVRKDTATNAAAGARPKSCSCGMPLCVCPPPPVAAASSSSGSDRKMSVASSKPPRIAQPTYEASNDDDRPGFFSNSQKPPTMQVNMQGDLNEQCREAVKAGDAEAVEKLLKAGATAKYRDKSSNSLLHLAAMFNRLDLIELLLKYGADLNVTNGDKETPYDLAPPALQFKLRAIAVMLRPAWD